MENWQMVLFASMRSTQNSMLLKTITATYYITWIFIGNFILLNLFLAILIDSFVTEGDEELVEDSVGQQRALKEKEK